MKQKIVWFTIGTGWDIDVDCALANNVPTTADVEVHKSFREAIQAALTYSITGREQYSATVNKIKNIRKGAKTKAIKSEA